MTYEDNIVEGHKDVNHVNRISYRPSGSALLRCKEKGKNH